MPANKKIHTPKTATGAAVLEVAQAEVKMSDKVAEALQSDARRKVSTVLDDLKALRGSFSSSSRMYFRINNYVKPLKKAHAHNASMTCGQFLKAMERQGTHLQGVKFESGPTRTSNPDPEVESVTITATVADGPDSYSADMKAVAATPEAGLINAAAIGLSESVDLHDDFPEDLRTILRSAIRQIANAYIAEHFPAPVEEQEAEAAEAVA